MRPLSPAFASAVAREASTLATCWIVTRRDGARLGFTAHDRPILVDGVACQPHLGADTGAQEGGEGLAPSTAEILGALDAAGLDAADLSAGLYDGATVEAWRVDWSDPEARHLLMSGTLGEVVRDGAAFRAEVRGPAAALAVPVGRLYQHLCDADLGDARCGVDLAPHSVTATLARLDGAARVVLAGLAAAPGVFARGRLVVSGGEAVGALRHIRAHRVVAGEHVLDLWEGAPGGLAPGDPLDLVGGCDKTFATCRGRFANQLNFRGFPHMPGTDWITSYPVKGDRNDGSRRTG